MDSDKEFDTEFENDESKWTEDESDLEYEIFTNESPRSIISTQSRKQIIAQPHWSCAQCNQLNNLKETFKCTQCDGMYEIGSPIIELIPTEQTLDWKCQLCTFVNVFSNEKCEICSGSKPEDKYKVGDSPDESSVQDAYHKRYRDKYSTTLVCGYLRALCKYWLDFKRTKHLCPFNATIPDILSNTVLQFFQFSNFWDISIYLLQYWRFDRVLDERNNIIQDNSTLLLNEAENDTEDDDKKKGSTWIHAFSSQKVERLGDYSWTLQIQHIDPYTNTREEVKCYIGVIQSTEDKPRLSHNSCRLFCGTEVGFGVYGYCGSKKFGVVSKSFSKPFRVNDIINVKLECTLGYYELKYMVNDEDMGVAWRIPNDKVYQLAIAFSSNQSKKDNNIYKIKCISFEKEPYVND